MEEKTNRMKRLIILLFGLFISISSWSQARVNATELCLLNGNDSTGRGSITGLVRYDAATGKYRFYNALTSTWFNYFTGVVSYGSQYQIPMVNASSTDFSYSANHSYNTSSNNYIAASGFTNTNSGTQNNNFIRGIGHSFLGTGNIRWADISCESNTVNASSTGLIHNPIITGTSNLVLNSTGQSMFNPQMSGGSNNILRLISGSGPMGAATVLGGRDNIGENAGVSIVGRYHSMATAAGSFALGYVTTYNGTTHTGTVPYIKAGGVGSINISSNSTAQTDGNGANAPYSSIWGGLNAHIPVDADGSAMIGVNGKSARASETYQTYVDNFNILTIPTNNDTLSQIMVRDFTTGQMKYRRASTIGGSLSGLTSTRVTFATSSTTIGDDADLTYISATNILTVGSAATGALGVGTSSPDQRLHSEVDDGSTNITTYPLRLTHTTSGTPSTGIGTGMEFEVETSASNNEIAASIRTVATNVGVGTEASDLLLSVQGSGGASPGERIRIMGSNGFVGIATSSPDRLLHSEYSDAALNVEYPLRLTRVTSGSSFSAGIGAGMEFETETSSGNNEIGTTLVSITTDVTPTSEDFDFVVRNMAAGATANEKFRVTSIGDVLATYSGTQYTLAKTLTNTATLDFPSVASLGTQTLTITLTGAVDGDIVSIGIPSAAKTTGLIYGTPWVSSANTVSIEVYNSTVGAIDPASGTFRASVTRY